MIMPLRLTFSLGEEAGISAAGPKDGLQDIAISHSRFFLFFGLR